jgi:hypothetical protein
MRARFNIVGVSLAGVVGWDARRRFELERWR